MVQRCLELRSDFDPPDLDRPGRLPHQQGLCEVRPGYQESKTSHPGCQLGAPDVDDVDERSPHDLNERCKSTPRAQHEGAHHGHAQQGHAQQAHTINAARSAWQVDDKVHEHSVHTARARRRAQRGYAER